MTRLKKIWIQISDILTRLTRTQNRVKLCNSLLIACLMLMPLQAHAMIESLHGHIDYSDNRYEVGPGDVLSYQVYHQPDFAQSDILVRPDGYASFNGLGELPVGGKTVEEITQMLQQQISDQVISPQVTVTLSHTRPGTVYLAGAVMHPGMFQLTANAMSNTGSKDSSSPSNRMDFKLSNILANAGGVMLNADLTQVHVRHANSNQEKIVNIWQMLTTGASNNDLWIQSGDSIYIPAGPNLALNDQDFNTLLRSSLGPSTFPVRVIGQVGKPGIVDLSATSPYLNSAIAQAQGYKDGANVKAVAIRRFVDDTHVTTIIIDPRQKDIALRPNDIVYISETKLYTGARYLDQVAKVFSPFASLASMGFGISYIYHN